jgi:hypothetical protein
MSPFAQQLIFSVGHFRAPQNGHVVLISPIRTSGGTAEEFNATLNMDTAEAGLDRWCVDLAHPSPMT